MSATLDNQRAHPIPSDLGTEILRVHVGSGVHGVTVSGQDDRDEMGICVENPTAVIGLDNFEQYEYRTQPQGHRSGYGDLDLTVYSLRKWARLACAGNPSILLPLFVPTEEVVTNTAHGISLRNNAEMFLSRQVASRFLGYMTAQREQMLGLRGKKHTNRPELIEQYGFDTKFAYHMLRLGIQGIELLTTKNITLPMPDPWRHELIALRNGERTKEWALELADKLELRLAFLKETATWFPERPNYARVNRWLIETYQDVWETRK